MLKFMRLWLARRAAEEYRRGFDHAAGRLLNGAHPDHLEGEVDGTMVCRELAGDAPSQFDLGMLAAIEMWRDREPAKEQRYPANMILSRRA